jgi:leucine dehydrogenase
MGILSDMQDNGHEQVLAFSEESAGLRGFIAIHNTTLGPGLGGVRIWPHKSEEDALVDVLRLSKAMTYKSAAADLPFGGGKAVIMADPVKDKTEALVRAYARYLDSLGGRYITTTDVGSTIRDLEYISMETKHVVGLPISEGGSGDTAIMTGLGVFMGMKACAKHLWGSDSLAGRTVAFQGFGKVAYHTAGHLAEEGARMVVTDINETALAKAQEMGAVIVPGESIYDQECDIFAPCALGGVLNGDTIPRLRCSIVAGGANNQLLTDGDGLALQRRGIVYAPDYIINAGGVINVSCEVGSAYNEDRAREKTLRIYETMEKVLDIARRDGVSTSQAADHLAQERIRAVGGLRPIYRG